jgi:hypothetical protein
MQQSDIKGIERSGAQARERGVSFFANPHLSEAGDSLVPASAIAWAAGWREADGGKDAALAALDRVRYW